MGEIFKCAVSSKRYRDEFTLSDLEWIQPVKLIVRLLPGSDINEYENEYYVLSRKGQEGSMKDK